MQYLRYCMTVQSPHEMERDMTVSELIKKLSKVDGNREVCVFNEDLDGFAITDVEASVDDVVPKGLKFAQPIVGLFITDEELDLGLQEVTER
jgi:hypothetical protein